VQLDKSDLLQHDVAVRVGEDFFLDTVFSTDLGIDQSICRDAGLDWHDFKSAMPLLLRKKVLAVGDDEAQVARARHIHAWKINFIQDSMA
jgi:hypothetical protein